MNNTKFKSGDKVVFCKSSLESGMIDAKEGDVFTIKECLGPGCRVASLKELPGYYHKTHFEHYVEKEKVMEKYIPKVGDKVKGFVFENGNEAGVWWDDEMGDYLEEIGEVVEINSDNFVIQFPDGLDWMYPLDLAYLAKIEEPVQGLSHEDSQIDWKIGQVVWDVVYGKGEVVNVLENVLRYPVVVKFVDGKRHFTEDGKTDEEFARTLFFSEPKIIAETKPPKKPFKAVFKQGDTIVVKWVDTTRVLILEKETERQVKGMDGQVWDKDPDVHFYKLGEQVKFS